MTLPYMHIDSFLLILIVIENDKIDFVPHVVLVITGLDLAHKLMISIDG